MQIHILSKFSPSARYRNRLARATQIQADAPTSALGRDDELRGQAYKQASLVRQAMRAPSRPCGIFWRVRVWRPKRPQAFPNSGWRFRQMLPLPVSVLDGSDRARPEASNEARKASPTLFGYCGHVKRWQR